MEVLLEKEFRRLLEILEDLGHIGTELEKSPEIVKEISDLTASEDVKGQQLVDHINFVRIPGYCAYQLTQEAIILLYLITVKTQIPSTDLQERRRCKKNRKIGSVSECCEPSRARNPSCDGKLETPLHTLDSKKVVESIIRKIGVREPFCQHGLMTHITNDDSTVRAILLSEVADLVAPNPLV